jgi:hypothetical protein
MSTHRNFLSQLITGDDREKPRRKNKLNFDIHYLRNGVRGYSSQKAMFAHSEDGCMVTCPATGAIGQNLHLVIDGVPAKFSCFVRNRNETDLILRFYEDLPTALIDRLTGERSGSLVMFIDATQLFR